MQHRTIISFLSGTLSPEQFGEQIADDVEACSQGCSSGGSGHVIVAEGPATMVTREHAARLLQALLDRRLTFEAANYLADGLIMSDDFDFEEAAVADAIAFVADDSRLPTRDETRAALAALS